MCGIHLFEIIFTSVFRYKKIQISNFKLQFFVCSNSDRKIQVKYSHSNLIAQIQQSSIQKVIFISSTSVYPRINKVMTEENEVVKNHPLVAIENLFRKNTFFETTIIRFAGLFGGERQPANWFKNGRKIPQPKGFVNMIHQEDCINIIHEIINQNCWNQVFNACSNHHPTRREFYTIAKLSKGFEVPEFKENEVYEWKIISSKKVQEVLNYKFIHDDLLKPL